MNVTNGDLMRWQLPKLIVLSRLGDNLSSTADPASQMLSVAIVNWEGYKMYSDLYCVPHISTVNHLHTSIAFFTDVNINV